MNFFMLKIISYKRPRFSSSAILTSFAIMTTSYMCKGEVMGWVVFNKIDNKTVDFMSFYTAKKFRAYRRGGGVIITIAIRKIQKKYSVVKLFPDDKARSLKRFYPHYFGSAFSEGVRCFYLDLTPKS